MTTAPIDKRFRISPKPGKTLLWIWLKRDLARMTGGTGVDLGAGSMVNRRFFACDHYIAVDIDSQKLSRGKTNFPAAEVFLGRIQDFLTAAGNTKQRRDIRSLVCVQTMGTNAHFEHQETVDVVRQMQRAVEPGGGMVFNIGAAGVDLSLIRDSLMKELSRSFEKVKVREYGAFHGEKHQTSRVMSFCIALVMHVFPPLRTLFGREIKKLYFCCYGKKMN